MNYLILTILVVALTYLIYELRPKSKVISMPKPTPLAKAEGTGKIERPLSSTNKATEHTHDFGQVLIFDIETNGLVRDWSATYQQTEAWPRIVQIAWSIVDERGRLVSQSNHIIQAQDFKIPIHAADTHGITRQKAIAEGVELKEVLQAFQDALTGNPVLVAHNMQFAYSVLAAEYVRLQMPVPFEQLSRISIEACASELVDREHPSLGLLYTALFQQEAETTYDAAKDVELVSACFFELAKRDMICLD